ncbi:HipA N-terminal domain-containing protein [Bdellovibrionota bacterium FG-1]
MKKIQVTLETQLKKKIVGFLYRRRAAWIFEYDPSWINSGVNIDPQFEKKPGPQPFKELPEFFSDRIPPLGSQMRGAYGKAWKLNHSEHDEMSLLVTVGHRGPTNYVFYPIGFTPGLWAELEKR